MRPLSHGDFARAVRGGSLDISEIEEFLLGMSAQARSAAKKVHSESVDRARAYLEGRMAQHLGGPAEETARGYLASFETYVAWDGAAEPCEKRVQEIVAFPADRPVRGRADILFDCGLGRYEPRFLLWDDLRMDRSAAEMIALPCLRAVEQRFGDGSVAFVDVWQLATRQSERVAATDAAAREGDVCELLRRLDG